MPTVEQDITVEAPIERAFDFWTNYQRFPEFMENVKEVRRTGPDMTHWVVETGGKTVEYDARVTQESNRRVAWKATGESRQDGEVRFESAGAGKTLVKVKFDYTLPSKLQEGAASVLGLDDHAVREDLKNFKAMIEDRNGAL